MKITPAKNTETSFTPISVMVTIESQEEFNALSSMTQYDLSVPNAIHSVVPGMSRSHVEILSDFLIEFRRATHDALTSRLET